MLIGDVTMAWKNIRVPQSELKRDLGGYGRKSRDFVKHREIQGVSKRALQL